MQCFYINKLEYIKDKVRETCVIAMVLLKKFGMLESKQTILQCPLIYKDIWSSPYFRVNRHIHRVYSVFFQISQCQIHVFMTRCVHLYDTDCSVDLFTEVSHSVVSENTVDVIRNRNRPRHVDGSATRRCCAHTSN